MKTNPASRGLRGALAVLVAVLVFKLPATAEQKEPLPSVYETLDVHVVNLEAVVTENGQPVHGLTARDFRLSVKGKEQPIEYFTEVLGGVAKSRIPVAPGEAGPVPTLPEGQPVGVSYLVFIDDYF
ncbi:MAG: hypothetical protein KDD47_26670, partial [Acidobacteria bacterium]|nr:hypothetical protein [Acidobacteriota bacterium]